MAPFRYSWMAWALVSEFWRLFHKAWGDAIERRYEKATWLELQQYASDLLRIVGLERRSVPRPPDETEPQARA